MKTGRDNKEYNGVKAGIWYTVGNMLVKSIPFLTLPLFTRLLTTNDFGIYNTYISYENIFSVIVGLGISGTIKVAKIDFNTKFDEYVSSALRIVLLLGTALLLLLNLILFKFSWGNNFCLNILIIQSVATAVYSIMGGKYVIEGQYIQNVLIAFVVTGINVAASLFFCFFFFDEDRAMARIVGTAMGAIFIACYLINIQRIKAPLKNYPSAERYALKLGIPLIPHQLSVSLLSQCDKIMIQSMIGNAEAGIYGLAVNITLVLSVILTSVDNAWTPWFYSMLRRKDYGVLKKKNKIFVVFFMYLTCGFLLIGPDLIHFMSEKSYWDSLYAFVPLTISVFFNFMYIFSVGVEYFFKKTGYISATTLACTLVNILLNYIMIKNRGYIAAAYATCFSRLLLFGLHYMRSKKLFPESIVSLKLLIGSALFVCMVGGGTLFFVNRILVRYMIAICITGAFFLFLKKTKILDEYWKR